MKVKHNFLEFVNHGKNVLRGKCITVNTQEI